MKLFLLTCLIIASAHAEYLSRYADVVSQAKKENKIGLVLMIGGYCPWCKKMKGETLQDPDIAKELEKDFVVGIIEKDTDTTYPKYLRPNFVPVTYFLNHKEEVINETVGFKKAEYFMDDLERARYMFAPDAP